MLYTPSPNKDKDAEASPKKLPPSDLMNQRWEKFITEHVPYVDQTDVFRLEGV